MTFDRPGHSRDKPLAPLCPAPTRIPTVPWTTRGKGYRTMVNQPLMMPESRRPWYLFLESGTISCGAEERDVAVAASVNHSGTSGMITEGAGRARGGRALAFAWRRQAHRIERRPWSQAQRRPNEPASACVRTNPAAQTRPNEPSHSGPRSIVIRARRHPTEPAPACVQTNPAAQTHANEPSHWEPRSTVIRTIRPGARVGTKPSARRIQRNPNQPSRWMSSDHGVANQAWCPPKRSGRYARPNEPGVWPSDQADPNEPHLARVPNPSGLGARPNEPGRPASP
jgi:hypothetical protein